MEVGIRRGQADTGMRAPLRSECKRFPDFRSAESAIDDFVEKPKEIGEIDPKAAIETSSVEPPIHERVVTLDHHEPFALEAIHWNGTQKKFIECAS